MSNQVAIIGMGPSGIASALQLKRQGIDALLFEKSTQGGLLKNAYHVENYLGFDAISGIDLLQLFKKQLKQHSIEPVMENVTHLDYDTKEHVFVIKTNYSIHTARYIVVASGTEPKTDPVLEAAPVTMKPYIYYEIFPICNERGKRIVIIGGGDAAFHFALGVSAHNDVCLVNRTSTIKAVSALAASVFQDKNVMYKENYVLKTIMPGQEKKLFLTFGGDTDKFMIESDYLIAGIGRLPKKDFYSSALLERESDLIAEGILYLTGDIKNGSYRQTSIAVADGVYSAMQIAAKCSKEDKI